MSDLTRKAIRASFLKLLNDRPFAKITVRDVTQDCGISRNSFYYHYQDIPALLEEIVQEDVDRIVARYPSVDSLEDCLAIVTEFALANKKAAYHIYRSVNRELFEPYMWRVCAYAVQTYLYPLFAARAVSDDDRRIIETYCCRSVFGQLSGWLSDGMPDNVTEENRRLCVLRKGMLEEMLARSESRPQ